MILCVFCQVCYILYYFGIIIIYIDKNYNICYYCILNNISHMREKLAKISQKITIISLVSKLVLLSFLVVWAQPVQAANLSISNVEASVTQEKVIITWQTSIPANGRVEYGYTDDYGRSVTARIPLNTRHEVNLFGLEPDKDYHFRVIAYTNDEQVNSFDQTFNTDDIDDLTLPEIKKLGVPYITGTTATIHWETSEPTSFVIYYGKTDGYGSRKSSGSRTILHEYTLTKLSPATTYHFKVEARDKDGNKAIWQDISFRTLQTSVSDQEALIAYNIKPISPNDLGLGNSSAVITWDTNKLANQLVRYGTSATKLNKKIDPKDIQKSFNHRIEITGLKPETRYYYLVESKDVFGKTIKSEVKSFMTKSLPVVLGAREVELSVNRVNKTPATKIYQVGSKIYALLNNRKYYVKNPEIFSRNGYSWSQVTATSVNQINALPDVKLVKSPDNSTVYYLYKVGQDKFLKMAIPSAAVFTSYSANSWNQIVTVDKLDLDSYQLAKLIKAKGNASVYLVENGIKKPFASAQAFLDRGYSWSEIVEVNDLHLNSYDTGPAIN